MPIRISRTNTSDLLRGESISEQLWSILDSLLSRRSEILVPESSDWLRRPNMANVR